MSQLAELGERQRQRFARSRTSDCTTVAGPGSFASSRPSDMAIETSRCWVPSWRSRRSAAARRRSPRPAAPRDACRSISRACSSACRRSLSSARLAAAQTDRTSPALCSSTGSCTSTATGCPSCSTNVERRRLSPSGSRPWRRRRRRSTSRPGTRRRARATGRPVPGPGPGLRSAEVLGPPSSTTRPATMPRANRRCRNTNSTATGTVANV